MGPYKYLLLAFLVQGFNSISIAARCQVTLEVSIENVRDTLGVVRVAVFANSETFLKTPLVSKSIRAEKGKVIVHFEGIAQGTYAISVIHDANRNGKLDTNFFGIPREGFGFSNDAMGRFGPPSFEKAKLELRNSQSVTITTRYY